MTTTSFDSTDEDIIPLYTEFKLKKEGFLRKIEEYGGDVNSCDANYHLMENNKVHFYRDNMTKIAEGHWDQIASYTFSEDTYYWVWKYQNEAFEKAKEELPEKKQKLFKGGIVTSHFEVISYIFMAAHKYGEYETVYFNKSGQSNTFTVIGIKNMEWKLEVIDPVDIYLNVE